MRRAWLLCVPWIVLAACGESSVSETEVEIAADAGPADGADRPEPPPDAADASLRDAAASPADSGPDAALVEAGAPAFDGTQGALPPAVRTRMTGSSWRQGCPVSLDGLALLSVPHWGFDAAVHRGELVVAASVAEATLGVFRALYDERFPIDKMRLVDEYDANDDRSMADNNTSAFNCRRITGGSSWSAHSYGTAIDLNPRQNPYVKGATVLPPEGSAFLDRTDVRPGMAVEGSGPVRGFDALGWGWGGRWSSPKDYQHFSADNR